MSFWHVSCCILRCYDRASKTDGEETDRKMSVLLDYSSQFRDDLRFFRQFNLYKIVDVGEYSRGEKTWRLKKVNLSLLT